MELEVRHLKVIRAIGQEGSLTRAATSLGLAQSALSGQLKRIERALGGPLFERDRAGARPTPLGELVLTRARVLVPAMHQLQDDARRFASSWQESPRFRVGSSHGPLLGALIDRISVTHPEALLSTHICWSTVELCELLIDGRLDFVLSGVCGRSAPPRSDVLSWRTVGRDPVFVMLGEDHPLADEPQLELSKLAEQRWAKAPGEGCFRDCFSAACARAGFTPISFFETDASACVELVQAGRAVGLCRATFPPTPGVVTVPLAGTPLSWRHVLGYDPETTAAATVPAVLMHARQAHAEAAHRNPRYAQWLATNELFGTAR